MMLKYYGRTFLPWIALVIVSGFHEQAGAVVGLATALALLTLDRRAGLPWDSLILEASTTVYMALLTALAFTAPDAAALNYGASMAIGWLALTAWVTLAVRHPFTEGIARRRVTEEIAATELFRSVNRVITMVWAAGFSVTAIALACLQHWTPDGTALLIACKVAGFTVPAIFTARYPDHARERHLAKLGTH